MDLVGAIDAKYGKNKENRPNPIVGMGLFMDADGFPLSFDLFPGNQNEQLTLKPLEQKVIRDFGCGEFVYCSDAGLASKNNKLFEIINIIMIDCVQGTALDNKNFIAVISENEKQYLLELVPTIKKMKDYIKKINIFIDKKDFSVNKFDMIDASGDNTTLTFLNKQFNVGVTDANFVGK